MKKRNVLIALVLAFCILMAPSASKAAENLTGKIQSHGTLILRNEDDSQRVELYAEDLYYLQNELDKLFMSLPGANAAPTAAVANFEPAPAKDVQGTANDSTGKEQVITE